MDPDARGQVQPVQVCAVEVTRGSSEHVQVAVDDDHGLAVEAEWEGVTKDGGLGLGNISIL